MCAKPDEVKPDAVYRELYCEMRRFRDYEFRASTWFSAFLAVLLGFVFVNRYEKIAPPQESDRSSTLQLALRNDQFVRFGVVGISFVVAATAAFIVKFSSVRYHELRTFTTYLEPQSKRERRLAVIQPRIKPHHLLYWTPWLMFILICVVLGLEGLCTWLALIVVAACANVAILGLKRWCKPQPVDAL
jgi:hypothetical protein